MLSKVSKVESISERIMVLRRKLEVSYMVLHACIRLYYCGNRILSSQRPCWIKWKPRLMKLLTNYSTLYCFKETAQFSVVHGILIQYQSAYSIFFFLKKGTQTL